MRSVVEIGASVPAFLGKLWKLVNDTETNHLISWSPGGKSFVIKNQADFARELLPLYYKHNNMASFIRQLNMYGFHKITSVENGGLRYENDEIEFTHPCFMKGHAYLLEHIKRKIANPKSIITSNESGEKILLKPELMNKVLTDVKQMKGKQESLDAKFSAMKQENEALWREVAILRQKHIKQQQIVNNLIQFLMSLVQPARPPNNNGNNVGVKRPYQLMINSAAHDATDGAYPGRKKNVKLDRDALVDDLNEENLEDGPTIHELVHDDILHNESSQDSMVPSEFMTIEIPANTGVATGHSPSDPSAPIHYHVTMVDGDDADIGGNKVPYPVCHSNGSDLQKTNEEMLVTSPSPSQITPSSPLDQVIIDNVISISPGTSKTKGRSNTPKGGKSLLTTSNFNNLNPSADLKLPAEIFASDDSVSDAGLTSAEELKIQNMLQNFNAESIVSTSKDKMLGGINIKVERPQNPKVVSKKAKKCSKDNTAVLNLADIKTELEDDFDWNNMSLATVNNNNANASRFPIRNEIDDHLDTMQTDLESLRELLRSDSYAFDTNTLLGTADSRVGPPMFFAIPSSHHTTNDYLFGSDDPFYGLTYNSAEERSKAANNAEGNQLMSYTGNIPDFEDINLPELECENSEEPVLSPNPGSSLNTPQVEVRSPSFTLKP